ncbi:MAG: hypothetical protein DRG69_00230 [Deltaproteobacteria bacterium]|nr:MAG: hypothetical protein DRG69_00230 [Deltaproteobacteria bacterium]
MPREVLLSTESFILRKRGLRPLAERKTIHLGVSDFPATQFFLHLSKGTRYFLKGEFEKAIEEWEAARRLRPELVKLKSMPGSILFRGNLGQVPLLGLLYTVYSNAQTGVAIVRSEYAFKEIFFKEGWIVFARTTRSEERLGNFMVKRGMVSREGMERIAFEAKRENKRLGEYLVEKGLISERELREILDFQIKEILCDLFTWREGEFYFAEKEIEERDVVVSYTPLDIALMAARRALDLSAFRKIVPHNRVIFRVAPHIEADKEKVMEKLDANERFIFSLIDGSRNVEQLIRYSGSDEASVLEILRRLLSMGFITKSRDIGVYEDPEFRGLHELIRILSDLLTFLLRSTYAEIGKMTDGLIGKVLKALREDHREIFSGALSSQGVKAQVILRNLGPLLISEERRYLFIEAFYELLSQLLEGIRGILGGDWTRRAVHELHRYRAEVQKLPPTTQRRKVVSLIDKLIGLYG